MEQLGQVQKKQCYAYLRSSDLAAHPLLSMECNMDEDSLGQSIFDELQEMHKLGMNSSDQ